MAHLKTGDRFFFSNPEVLERLIVLVDIRQAEASFSPDRDRILSQLEGSEGGLDRVNEVIKSVIFGASKTIPNSIVTRVLLGDPTASRVQLCDADITLGTAAASGHSDMVEYFLDNTPRLISKELYQIAMRLAYVGGHVKCANMIKARGNLTLAQHPQLQNILSDCCSFSNISSLKAIFAELKIEPKDSSTI
jgi:hypothetical protein